MGYRKSLFLINFNYFASVFTKHTSKSMRFFKQSVRTLFASRYKKIEFFKKNPVEQQEQVLNCLLTSSRKTEWGRMYHYEQIRRPDEYARQVPVSDYEVLKSYIERMVAGEKNVLWPGMVKWFAKSSGTTNDKSKFIPVSDESLKNTHLKAPLDIFTLYLNNYPNYDILRGKNLSIGGSHKVSELSTQTRTGDLSAVMLSNLPFFSRLKNCPSSDIALIPDFELKVDKIIKSTIHENITSMSGVPSWFLVMIRKMLDFSGKENLLEVWPNLEVFIHGGVNFDPYREQYRQLIPSDRMNYMNTYNASEGFFSIQDQPGTDDMLLMLDYGIYFEFIDMADFHSEDRKVINLSEVKTGVNYALVISTNGGLWRYLIGDTVMFTSVFPFKIKITGRTRHFINTFGEELIIDNAEKALKLACDKTGAVINEYTAGPVFMGSNSQGAHQWIIEFEKEPDDTEQFAEILDKELQGLNSDYEAKRYKNFTLNRLILLKVPKGTFYEWLKSRGKFGGQNKVPRLANHREYLDSILDYLSRL